MKKILCLVLSVFLLASVAFFANAAVNTQDGIEIELTTDKTEYEKGERIEATITVTNTNSYDATDVSLESVVPDGYWAMKDSLKLDKLAAGETATLQAVMIPTGTVILWIVVIAVAVLALAIVIFIVIRKKMKRVTAAVLCLAILVSLIPAGALTFVASGSSSGSAEDLMVGEEDEFEQPEVSTGGDTDDDTGGDTDDDTGGDTDDDTGGDTSAVLPVEDDFTTFAPTLSTSAPATQGWWVNSMDAAAKTDDNTVKLTELRYYIPAGVTDNYTLEFKYQITYGGSFYLKTGASVEQSTLQTQILFAGYDGNNQDRALIYNGTTGKTSIFGGENVWHTVHVVVDNTNKTYKLYVDGDQIALGADAVTDFALFNDDVSVLKRINFAKSGSTGEVYLDDFKLYLGAPDMGGEDSDPNEINFSDDFSTFDPKLGSGAPTTQKWWTPSTSTAVHDTTNENVKVTDLSYYIPGGVTKNYTVEFKYRTTSGGVLYLKTGASVEQSTLQTQMIFSGNNGENPDRVLIYNGQEGKSNVFGGENVWHTVHVVVDNTNKTYKLFVDGEKLATGTDSVTEFGFWNPEIDTLKRISFTTTGSTGDVYLDDFKVYVGAPDLEEDTSDPNKINFSDDFTTFDPLVSGSTPTRTTWWLRSDSGAAHDTENQNVKITDLNFYVPGGVTENYTVEFKYQAQQGGKFYLKMGSSVESTTLQTQMIFSGNNGENPDRVMIYNGQEGKNNSFGGENVWHTVHVVVDNTNKTYKLFVDGEKLSIGADSVTNFGFWNPKVDVLKRINFSTPNDSTGDVYLDDFKIYIGAPDLKEDTSDPNDINFSDDFSTFEPIVTGSVPTRTTWWVTSADKATLTSDGKLKVQELRFNVPGGITEDYTVEFKYQLPKGSVATVKMGASVESTTLQTMQYFSGNNGENPDRVLVYDGTSSFSSLFGGENEWHTVKIIVSNTDDTYRLLVDGKRIVNAKTGDKVFDFYTAGIEALKRVTFTCTTGDLLLDDFKIYTGGDEHTPDPVEKEETFKKPLIYEQTFDSWDTGDYESGSKARWSHSVLEGSGASISVVKNGSGNKVLRITNDPESTAAPKIIYTLKEPLTKSYTLEVKFREVDCVGMVTMAPADGDVPEAGPDLRTSKNTSLWTQNGYQMALFNGDEDGWHVMHVYVDMKARTYDVYVNGMLQEEGIPFRNTDSASMGKLCLGFAMAKGGTEEYDYIRIYEGKVINFDGLKEVSVDGFKKQSPTVVLSRDLVQSNYSDVNISTRTIRNDGYLGYAGSANIVKQFMVTQDRWIYCDNTAILERISGLGVAVQLTLSPNCSVAGKNTNAVKFDGTECYFNWLDPSTNEHACLNNPAIIEFCKNRVKTAVENGARSIQHDDPTWNYAHYSNGGCFCDYCMDKFTDWLLDKYTAAELKEIEPDYTINKNFNYHTYLEKVWKCKSNGDYMSRRAQIALDEEFKQFQFDTTYNYHVMISEYMDSLGYGDIKFSVNNASIALNLDTSEVSTYLTSVFDMSIPETGTSQANKKNMVASAFTEKGLDREIIFGVIPTGNYLTKLRNAVARSYALGVQVLIPWDTYTGGDRAYSSVEEVGDLYHFVRQYPYLFDDYEVPAVVGVTMNLDSATSVEITDIINTMFDSGIPFKMLFTTERDPYLKVTFDAEDVDGLEYIYGYTPVKGLTEDQQSAVNESGAQQIQLYPLMAKSSSLRTSWVADGTDDIYATMRTYNGEIGGASSVHVINETGNQVTDTQVCINRKYLPAGDYSVTLYRPGYDPVAVQAELVENQVENETSEKITIGGKKVELSVKLSCNLENTVCVNIPEMTEWSILHVTPENAGEGTNGFTVSDGWSGISLGTGAAEGDAIVQNGTDAFTLTTAYTGMNVCTETDKTGSQDMMPFAYKNVTLSQVNDYSLEAKVSAIANSGVMIRELPNANARFIALYVADGKLMAAVRAEDNKSVFYREIAEVTGDTYVKLVKKGVTFELYTGTDGQNWGENLITVEMTLEKPLAGVFAFSADGKSTTATVSGVKLTDLGVNEDLELKELTVVGADSAYIGEGKSALSITCTTAVGQTLTDEDFDSVTYESSDTSVFTVNENKKIVGAVAGEATLKVTATVGKHTVTTEKTVVVEASGKMLIDENFDLWTPATASANWVHTASTSSHNTYVTQAMFPSATDRSLGFVDNSASSDRYIYSLDEDVEENYTLEFDYYVETKLDASKIQNLNTMYIISSSSSYISCLYYEGGKFKYFDNTLWHTLFEADVNQWIHIKIDMNFDDQTNTYTFTDSAGKTVTVTHPLRNPGTDTSRMMFTTNYGASGMTVYYNNLKMYLSGK